MNIVLQSDSEHYPERLVRIIERRIGYAPEVSTADHTITMHFPDLTGEQPELDWLVDFLQEHPEPVTELELEDWLDEQLARQAELEATVEEVHTKRMTVNELQVVVIALAKLHRIDPPGA